MFHLIKGFLSILLTAVVVKLMDDFLDIASEDQGIGLDYGEIPLQGTWDEYGCNSRTKIRGLAGLFMSGDTSLDPMISRSILPYSLMIFSIAASLYPVWAITLFLSSYAVGMANDLSQQLPLSLTALQESVAAIALGSLAFGWFEMMTSFFLMLSVQVLDDFMDQKVDLRTGRWNIVRRYGRIETLTIAAGISLLVLSLAPAKAVCTLLGASFIWGVERFLNHYGSAVR